MDDLDGGLKKVTGADTEGTEDTEGRPGGSGSCQLRKWRVACPARCLTRRGHLSGCAADRVPERLRVAEQMGASATLDATQDDVVDGFKRHAGKRPDVVLECVGVPGTQQLAMDYAPMGGRIVVLGVCMAPDTIRPVKAMTKELQVNYVYMYRREEFELTIDLLDRERLDPSPMLTRTVGFDDFPQAFEALKVDKTACKVVLQP